MAMVTRLIISFSRHYIPDNKIKTYESRRNDKHE